jgi:hypothetical protein
MVLPTPHKPMKISDGFDQNGSWVQLGPRMPSSARKVFSNPLLGLRIHSQSSVLATTGTIEGK